MTDIHAFLFTDIEGSTALWAADAATMAAALERHDELVRGAITEHGGKVFKTVGDAVCAVFSDPTAAIRCIVQANQLLAEQTWPTSRPIRIRSAIHAGPVLARAQDFFGPTVNEVARILSLANPEQILISDTASNMVSQRDEFAWMDCGHHTLKGVPRQVQIWQVSLTNEIPRFPALRSGVEIPTNLQALPTSFHGRLSESRSIVGALTESRLVTLIGSGGTGKTRLASEIALATDKYKDGVWFVSLADCTSEDQVWTGIADVLSLSINPFETLRDRLFEHLKSQQVLFVFDNCEQVQVPVSHVVNALHSMCPDVSILATSRTALGLKYEHRITLLPLPVAENDSTYEELVESPSVQLFLARARAADASFATTDSDLDCVKEICAKVSGIPLAIELVAARTASLPLQRIADRLEGKMLSISNLDPSTEGRQKTLSDAIKWSYDLLDSSTKQVLQRLSVFAGGFTLEAAEMVCSCSETPVDSIEDSVAELARNSLLYFDRLESRYRFLEPIREFAAYELKNSDEENEVRNRHLAWAQELAAEAEPHLPGAEASKWLARLDIEHDNIRAALTWATEPEQRLRLASALHRYWRMRSLHHEGIGWMSNAIQRPAGIDAALLTKAQNSLGILLWSEGRFIEAEAALKDALAGFQAMDNLQRAAGAMANLGNVYSDLGELAKGEEMHRSAIEAYQKLGDELNMHRELANLGSCLIDAGKTSEALEIFESVLTWQDKEGDSAAMATTLGNIAQIKHEADRAGALKAAMEACDNAIKASDHALIIWLMLPIACVAHAYERLDLVQVLLARRKRETERNSIGFGITDRATFERLASLVKPLPPIPLDRSPLPKLCTQILAAINRDPAGEN